MGGIKVKSFQIILLLTMCLTFVGCGNCVNQNNPETGPVTGDNVYIPENYKTQLASMKLSEVVSLPYFTKPFICVAKDQDQQQFAIVFHSDDKFRSVKLNTPEQIEPSFR
jgi:hypothetical protein